MDSNKCQKSTTEILEEFPNAKRDKLIPILQRIQDSHRYLSKDSIRTISRFLNLPITKVYGVASFYNQFCFEPLGEYEIKICRGTACHVTGSLKILKYILSELKINENETTNDGLFTIKIVSCAGACGLAPVISINEIFHSQITLENVKKIILNLKKKEMIYEE